MVLRVNSHPRSFLCMYGFLKPAFPDQLVFFNVQICLKNFSQHVFLLGLLEKCENFLQEWDVAEV